MGLEPSVSAFFVGRHQTAVADRIQSQYRCQATRHVLPSRFESKGLRQRIEARSWGQPQLGSTPTPTSTLPRQRERKPCAPRSAGPLPLAVERYLVV